MNSSPIILVKKHRIDLRKNLTRSILNQGLLQSCIACALSIAVDYLFNHTLKVHHSVQNTHIHTSPMFIYYHMRLIENKLSENVPLVVDESVQSLVQYGVCTEALWPYPEQCHSQIVEQLIAQNNINSLAETVTTELNKKAAIITETLSTHPTKTALAQAKQFTVQAKKLCVNYGIHELKRCLKQGIPFIFGLNIPISFFNTPKSGIVKIPQVTEKRLGGHAFIALGFDEEKQVLICRNSLGDTFGDNGDCYLPYDFITGSYIEENGTEVANTFSFWYLYNKEH